MALRNRIMGIAAAALALAPAAAFANGLVSVKGRIDIGGLDIGVRIHTGTPSRNVPPPPPPRSSGRYELQTVERWIPGYTERVWVAEQCTTIETRKRSGKGKGRGNKKIRTETTCTPGHYADRVIPGRYVQEEQWAWVDRPVHRAAPVIARR